MRKAQEAEDRRKENAENKAKLAAAKGGDAKGLDDGMKRKRKGVPRGEEGKGGGGVKAEGGERGDARQAEEYEGGDGQ